MKRYQVTVTDPDGKHFDTLFFDADSRLKAEAKAVIFEAHRLGDDNAFHLTYKAHERA
jgi:hypothetical protein